MRANPERLRDHREYPIRYSSVVKDLLRSTLRLESGTGYQKIDGLLVEITGIEPVTSGLQSRRSPS